MKIIFTGEPIPDIDESGNLMETGAELIFLGRVRDAENGIAIAALDYEYYPEMAEKNLAGIARKTIEKFDLQDLDCIHRFGRVTVGEASVKIVIRSRHRKAALQAMDWFIDHLKKEVPVWKWGITPDGGRFPSDAV